MGKKIHPSILKRISILSAVLLMVFCAFVPLINAGAMEVSYSELPAQYNARHTSRIKTLYWGIAGCMYAYDESGFTHNLTDAQSPEQIKRGEWFMNTRGFDDVSSFLLEALVQGWEVGAKYSDSKGDDALVECDEKDWISGNYRSGFVAGLLRELGMSIPSGFLDLACNTFDGHATNGLLRSHGSESNCGRNWANNGDFDLNAESGYLPQAINYLGNFIKKFDPESAAAYNSWQLTDAEQYYFAYDTFSLSMEDGDEGCGKYFTYSGATESNAVIDTATDKKLTIVNIDPNNTVPVETQYIKMVGNEQYSNAINKQFNRYSNGTQNSHDYAVDVYNEVYFSTCGEFFGLIGQGSSYSKAAMLLTAKRTVDKCISDFDGLVAASEAKRNSISSAASKLEQLSLNLAGLGRYIFGENPYTENQTKDFFKGRVDALSGEFDSAFNALKTAGDGVELINGGLSGALPFLQELFDALTYNETTGKPESTLDASTAPGSDMKASLDTYISGFDDVVKNLNDNVLPSLNTYIAERKTQDDSRSSTDGVWYIDDLGVVECFEYQDPTMDTPAEFTPPAGVVIGDSGMDGSEEQDPCYTESGSMGWILCPLITGLGDFMKGVYERTIQPFLQIDASLLARESPSGGAGGTFQAWAVFQAVANIVFIILLLVVIFSQLTGAGIDNYGIKKILPKLIITALLINLSYILCQLAVDISNVLGFSLNGFLTNIANNVSIDSASAALEGGSAFAMNSATAVIAIVGGIVGFFAVVTQGWALIIPILFAVISGAIAIFFLFVLLGVRKAGVVILVALSPLAFVCYTLPNTKKLFDKWLKMLQGLLMLFPICGLLIGGGYLTSRILMAAGGGDPFVQIIALLLLVVPFFFIPMLLKGSFAAMGNIGAKINGIGKSFSKGTNDKLRNSNFIKDRRAKWAAGKDGGLRERIAARTGIGKRALARNRLEDVKRYNELQKASGLVGGSGYSAEIAKIDRSVRDDEVKSQEALIAKDEAKSNNLDTLERELSEAIQNDVKGNNASKIKAYQNVLAAKGDHGRQAVHNAMLAAEARAATPGGRAISAEAKLAYGSNIMESHAAAFKDNSRDTHDYALKLAQGSDVRLEDYEGKSAANFKETQMANMDDAAFERHFGALGDSSKVPQDGAAAKAAWNALHNTTISNTLNQGRRAKLEEMAKRYKPTEEDATMVTIHSPTTPPTPPTSPTP